MTLLLILAILLAVGGFVAWLSCGVSKEAGSSLAASLMTGAILAGVFLALQQAIATNAKKVADRQTLRLTVGPVRDPRNADLSGRDFSGFALAGKTMSGADLHGAVLRDASLRKTNLDNANLTDADLRGADLRGAHLRYALLNGADLRGADLFGANLDGAAIGVSVTGKAANLSGATLNNTSFVRACLPRADLRRATLGGSNLSDTVLTGADLRGAVLEEDGVPAYLDRAAVAHAKFDKDGRAVFKGDPLPKLTDEPAHRRPRHPLSATITHVSDGDTIELGGLGWVRLVGIDAPPVNEDPVGDEAYAFVNRLTGNAVTYELETTRRELRFGNTGRLRAYVWSSDGRFLNAALLTSGYAQRKAPAPEDGPKPENGRYTRTLDDAQRYARGLGVRIWGTCRSE